MSRSTFLIVLLCVIALIEVYTFIGLKTAFRAGWTLRTARAIHLIGVAITVTTIAGAFLTMRGGLATPGATRNWLMGLMVTFFVTKLTFAFVLGLDDIVRFLQFGGGKVAALFSSAADSSPMPGRRKFIAQAGIVLAAVPFVGFLHGIIRGRYAYTVHSQRLSFPDLPDAFEGLKIVQISDIHAGSFDDKEAVAEGIRMIQAQNPDIILFTGDLVNNLAEEAEPYLDLFASLHAPLGKYSVLGNHDYGKYVQWDSPQAKADNHARIRAHHATMGFRLLANESLLVQRGDQAIRLAGVENWGQPPFPQYGDLDLALDGVQPHEFTILMSHDPDHWEAQVLPHPKHIHLTLSGHTHGFQIGIEIPGIKISPVQLRYKHWAGLYTQDQQNLYVNRGFGFIGFPGRVGIWPEITAFELHKA